jgi:protein ImuA
LQAGGADRLQVRILKRRGPPRESPLQLPLPPVLSDAARRRSESGWQRRPESVAIDGREILQAATFVNLEA